ncbi:MAG: AraC family transcriptional regulator [Burkholderiales bacterium]|nr:AraC family transcriptional regulator [Burkholderiales bacterium]
MTTVKPAGPRVVGAYAQTAVDTALDAGLPRERVAALLDVPTSQLQPLPEAIPVAAYLRLLDGAAKELNDDCFGLHVGERMRLATFAVYGMVLMACRTFGEALEQVIRFESLAHDLGRSRIHIEGDRARYEWHSPYLAEASRHLPESVFAGIVETANWMARRHLPAQEIALTGTTPPKEGEYHRILKAPLRFGAAVPYAYFDAAILSMPMPNADTSLFPVLTKHAETLLAERARELSEPPILGTVRQQIAGLLTRDGANLAAVADALAMSPRTLQRRLTDAGTTFQQLLDATRRELAAGYLERADLSLTDIAFLLGFSEQSSFSHAFRDWYGQSPANYRAAQHTRH